MVRQRQSQGGFKISSNLKLRRLLSSDGQIAIVQPVTLALQITFSSCNVNLKPGRCNSCRAGTGIASRTGLARLQVELIRSQMILARTALSFLRV